MSVCRYMPKIISKDVIYSPRFLMMKMIHTQILTRSHCIECVTGIALSDNMKGRLAFKSVNLKLRNWNRKSMYFFYFVYCLADSAWFFANLRLEDCLLLSIKNSWKKWRNSLRRFRNWRWKRRWLSCFVFCKINSITDNVLVLLILIPF